MKFLLAVLLFSSMLFAMQKQIIVGCYSVQSNAKNALNTLKKQIEKDNFLLELVQKNKLKAVNAEISGYHVVSINYFDSYTQTSKAVKALKKYYPDAYTLRYPIETSVVKEVPLEVKSQVVEKEKLTKLVNEVIEHEVTKEKEELPSPKIDKPLVDEHTEKMIEIDKVITEVVPIKEELVQEEGYSFYYILLALVLLALIIAGIVINKGYKNKNKEENTEK